MRASWGATRAIMLAILRERFNVGFRFSKVKQGVWKYVIQVAAVLLFSGVTREMFQHAGLTERIVVMLLDALGFSLVRVFLVAPKQMFKPTQHTLPLLTPAPPLSVLTGQVLADMPVHLWSMLMFAWVMSSGLALSAQLAFIAVMGAIGMVIVTLSMFAGHLILVLWARWVPGGLLVFLVLAVIGQLALVALVFYLLIRVDVIDPGVWQKVTLYGEWAVAVLGALFAGLLLWFAAMPARFDRWYLEGWLAHNEGTKGKKAASQRSRWPFRLSGAVGSLWAKDLILVRNNPIYRVRMITWTAAAAAIAALLYTGWLQDAVDHVRFFRRREDAWLCVFLAIVPGHLVVAEMIATLFELDRNKRTWFVIACTSPWQIMRSKLYSGALFYLLPSVGLSVLFGLLLALPPLQLLAASLFTALLSFALVAFCLGIAAWDVKREEVGRVIKTDAMREQVPQTIPTLAANIGSLVLLGAAFLWIDDFAWNEWFKGALILGISCLILLVGTLSIGKRM